MDQLDWQNGYEAVLTDRITLSDTYIKMSPVPSTDKGRVVIEDNSATNYEIVHFTSKDANGIYADARNEDSNSTGVHAKGVRVRMNITAQDLKEIRDAVNTVVSTYAATTVNSIASGSTITPDANIYTVTALAAGASVAAPTGTPIDGQPLILRIKDNGTARALSWNAIYSNITGLDMPTTTVANKWTTVCCLYNTSATKWQVVSISVEA